MASKNTPKVGQPFKGGKVSKVSRENKGTAGMWVIIIVEDTRCFGEWLDEGWKDDGCINNNKRYSRKVNAQKREWEESVKYLNSTLGDKLYDKKIIEKTFDKPASGTQGIWSWIYVEDDACKPPPAPIQPVPIQPVQPPPQIIEQPPPQIIEQPPQIIEQPPQIIEQPTPTPTPTVQPIPKIVEQETVQIIEQPLPSPLPSPSLTVQPDASKLLSKTPEPIDNWQQQYMIIAIIVVILMLLLSSSSVFSLV